MKQLTTLVLLVLLAPAIATAQFSLAVAGETGRAWNLLVHYIPEDGGQTALQFDLLLPDGLTVEPVSETTVPDNYTVQWARQTDGNIRVVIYCGTGTTFETAKHIVFSCRLTATEDLPAGNYTVHLTGGRASAPHGAEYVLDNTAYTINVPEPVSASYRVTWLIDGQFFSEQTVEEGNALVPPAVPEREGYTFSGWQNLPEVMPAEDIVVSGQWTVNIYRLLYYLDGELYDSQEVPYGTPLQPLPAPVPEEQFSGWSKLPETMPAHDVTVIGTTVISSIKTPAPSLNHLPVYFLNGRFAGYYSTALRHSLPTGVYVVGGRKVIVKPH
ncbi:MAG TPA: InlB B-repeat-containing protein [Alloprevotella sp.]|nr:InlB B-repeat-containing protein [Alloprevotella sp.]